MSLNGLGLLVFNTTFNNVSLRYVVVSVIGVPVEYLWPVASQDKLYHIMLYWVYLASIGLDWI